MGTSLSGTSEGTSNFCPHNGQLAFLEGWEHRDRFSSGAGRRAPSGCKLPEPGAACRCAQLPSKPPLRDLNTLTGNLSATYNSCLLRPFPWGFCYWLVNLALLTKKKKKRQTCWISVLVIMNCSPGVTNKKLPISLSLP